MKQDRLAELRQDRSVDVVAWAIAEIERLRRASDRDRRRIVVQRFEVGKCKDRNGYLQTERDLLRANLNVVCKERDDATRALKGRS